MKRQVVASMVGAAAALTVAAPAYAHTEISIDPARAGARNAVATVDAEAESESAGVTKVQIFLPDGISGRDLTPVSLPKGWQLTTEDGSYTVAGAALPVGRDAVHKVRIRQLPRYESVTFKVLQSYSDGRTDRWIALPTAEDPEPANPAPTVKLAGGSGTAPATRPPSSPSPGSPTAGGSPAASGGVASSAAVVAEPAAPAGRGTPAVWWVAGIGALLVLGAGAAVLVRRRRPPA
jgi:uncharacterized protein YcnI